MGKKEKQDNLKNKQDSFEQQEENCEEEKCDCQSECDCGQECSCQEGDECCCGQDCECHTECNCEKEEKIVDKAEEYLALAQRLQADFDNYRKRISEQLDFQRQEGIKSVIEIFLPCLDAFSEAKKSVSDEATLAGINMIEEKILSALKTLNVEKIEAVGQKFDHNFHNVIAVMKDDSKDEDIILQEYQSGWMMNGKVLRYSKVVVNKK